MGQYIDNKELRKEIRISQDQDELTARCIEMFIQIVDGVQSKFKYLDEDDKADVRCRSIEQIIVKYKMCDLDKYENTFSWVTQTVKNGLYAGWNEINKSRADFSTSNIFMDDV